MNNDKKEKKFWKTEDEVDIFVKSLITEHRQDLIIDAIYPTIVCFFQDKANISKGHISVAKIYKVSDKINGLCSAFSIKPVRLDFIIQIAFDIWKTLSDTQKLAVLFHELAHVGIRTEEDEETGKTIITYFLRGHDVEEFASVIKLFGFYMDDILNFAQNLPPVGNEIPKERTRVRRIS